MKICRIYCSNEALFFKWAYNIYFKNMLFSVAIHKECEDKYVSSNKQSIVGLLYIFKDLKSAV